MATKEYNALMSQKNGNDLQILYPITTIGNVDGLQEQLDSLNAGAQNKPLVFKDKVVAASAFVSDSTYSQYPYKANVTCTGVTADYVPDVTFYVDDAISGVFAHVSESGTNLVSIYATVIPSSSITIPIIVCTKGDVAS